MEKRKPLKLRLADETPSEPLAAAVRTTRGRDSSKPGSAQTQRILIRSPMMDAMVS